MGRALLSSIGWFSTAFMVAAMSFATMVASRPTIAVVISLAIAQRREHRRHLVDSTTEYHSRSRRRHPVPPSTFHSNAARKPVATEMPCGT